MKLYTCTGAPSPRRVTLYLAAKGIELETVEVDLRAGEHLSDDFAARSPDCTVPVLELDNGEHLFETGAIRRYLEELHPEPSMFGSSPESRAQINQWTDRVFAHGLLSVMDAFRNASPGFKDHALTGRRPVAQIPALAERARDRYAGFLDLLDERLQSQEHVGGAEFSVADIDALVTIDFAARAIRIAPDPQRTALSDWHQRMRERFAEA